MLELIDLRNNFIYYSDFYISAKEKSYAEASRKNNVSTSSLSRSVSTLENLLNLKLVNSSNKGFELTLDGERLYKKLDALFKTIVTYNTNEMINNLDVTLNIGTTRNISDYALPKYLCEFNKMFPNVKINIYTDSATNLNNYLINHKIDILIDYLPQINSTEKYELEVFPIKSYKTCFACSNSYYEEVKNSIKTLNDLKNYKLTIPGNSRRRQLLDNILQANNINLDPTLQMPDSRLMAEIVKNNNYIGYFIEEELKEYDLKKIEIKEKLPINSIGIIYHKNINNIAKKFIDMIKADNNSL